ncbi:hypothetical protein BS17DRAFT_714159, partial [Gyrodon lividus]
ELKFNKKFELVADPGQYEGDKAKFNEWWTKMQIWINANWDGMETNMEICCVVWSCMKGLIAGQYVETQMGNCLAKREEWPEWKDLKPEIKGFFRPQTEANFYCRFIKGFATITRPVTSQNFPNQSGLIPNPDPHTLP